MTTINQKLIKISIQQLVTTDAHIGHSSKLRNPYNISNIFGTYQSKDLINLEKTLQSIEPAINIIIDSTANYETLLIIAQHQNLQNIQSTQPILTSKWVHGALSNFKIIKQSKKNHFFQTLSRMPNAIILLHATNDQIIFSEAKLLEIPIIALRDTNQNPSQSIYPIPCNSDSNSAKNLLLRLFSQASLYGYAKNVLSFKQKKDSKQID